MTPSIATRRPGRAAARLAVAAAVGIGASLLAVPPAQAAQPSYIRLAHFSPDTPNVTVILTSFSRPGWKLELPGVGYGTLSSYQRLPAALYTVSMRMEGAAAQRTPQVLTTTVKAVDGAAYTVAGVGPYAKLGLTVLQDDLSLPSGPDQVRVRVLQASAKAGTVAVRAVGGRTIAPNVDFAKSTEYATVPAGSWRLMVSPTGQPGVTTDVTLNGGSVYSVIVLDDDAGEIKVEVRTDAASGARMPQGGVETGAGGTAAPDGSGPWLPAGLGLAALAVVGAAVVRSRQTRRVAPAELAPAGR